MKLYPNLPSQTGPSIHSMKNSYSLLDNSHPLSQISKSRLRGLMQLALAFGLSFILGNSILNYKQKGSLFDQNFYNSVQEDLILCIMIWPIFTIWSFTSLLLQFLIIKGLPPSLCLTVQIVIQVTPLLFASFISIQRNWCPSHSAFVTMQASVHLFKMHSYTTTNRDYRQQKLLAQALGLKPSTPYPHNVSFRNYCKYLLMPVLVYQWQYPLRQRVDIIYLCKKIICAIGSFLSVYIIYTDYIYVNGGQSLIQMLTRCIVPSFCMLLIIFYFIFDCFCNIFGEVTGLADRSFYQDWWNSSHFEEFNRKWNQRVYEFLYRHVYLQAIKRYNLTKQQAQLATFLFSAILHQYVMAMIFKSIKPVMLLFMMGQIPLFILTRGLKGQTKGTFLVSFGLVLGPTLIICLYLTNFD